MTLPPVIHPLTVEWVGLCLPVIEAAKQEPAAAHVLEDELYRSVLNAVARGDCLTPSALCTEALKTRSIMFERWMA